MVNKDIQKIIDRGCNCVEKIFYKRRFINIIELDYGEKGLGYHFKVTNPCDKGKSLYSIPFISKEDAKEAAYIVIRDSIKNGGI